MEQAPFMEQAKRAGGDVPNCTAPAGAVKLALRKLTETPSGSPRGPAVYADVLRVLAWDRFVAFSHWLARRPQRNYHLFNRLGSKIMDSITGEVWFLTGSQHLYGPGPLEQVAANSRQVVEGLNGSGRLPLRVVFRQVVTSSDSILQACREANAAAECAGVICWMHTFSPAKMWIAGLRVLEKPLAHLHTQFNRDLPWGTIDMDFMNLNQAAHGDREFGHICARMRKPRKVVVGHWQEADVQEQLAAWERAAAGWNELRRLKVARLGDNMRQVAVTEGDKVEAQIRLGMEVNGYGLGDLLPHVDAASDAAVDRLTGQYDQQYRMAPPLAPGGPQRQALRYAARVELGLRSFLESGGFRAFTDTFEDLGTLAQLPGLAVQRLMADGYGFGAEGDWKTAALVRAMKVMAAGLPGGTSFMEDYTYHLHPSGGKVLGAHMLELCPSLAARTPCCEIHSLGIGGKSDPVRLVFTAPAGPAVNAALLDLGDRFRLLLNEVDAVEPEADLPRLPVSRALWSPRPNLKTAAAAWIYAGGPHHTVFSQALTSEPLEDLAEMIGIECLRIDSDTRLGDFKNQLRWNQASFSHGNF
jgi:L-arabinose isomerase